MSSKRSFGTLRLIAMLASLAYVAICLTLQGLRMWVARQLIELRGVDIYQSKLVRMGRNVSREVWRGFSWGGQCTLTETPMPPVLRKPGVHVVLLNHPQTLETAVVWVVMYRITYWMIGSLKSGFRFAPFGFGLAAAKQVIFVYRDHKQKGLPEAERARLAEQLRNLLRQQMRETVEFALQANVPVVLPWFINSRWSEDRAAEAEHKFISTIPNLGLWIDELLPPNPGGVHDLIQTIGHHVTSWHIFVLGKDRKVGNNGWIIAIVDMFKTHYLGVTQDVTAEVRALSPNPEDVRAASLTDITTWLNEKIAPRMAAIMRNWRQKREIPR